MPANYVLLALERYGDPPWMCDYCDKLIERFGKESDEGHVHHIDGDHENDNPKNLAIVHCACHTQIHRIGYKHTEETRTKIAEAHKGKPKSPEHIAALKANHVGMLGKKHSPKTREKQSIAQRGKPKSQTHRDNIRKSALTRRPQAKVECVHCGLMIAPSNVQRHIKAKHSE